MGKVLQAVEPVNEYATVHPALDFWDDRAIVSIGCKWQETYEILDRGGNHKGNETRFTNLPYCILPF